MAFFFDIILLFASRCVRLKRLLVAQQSRLNVEQTTQFVNLQTLHDMTSFPTELRYVVSRDTTI